MKVKLKMNTYSYFTDGAATMAKENGKYLRKEGGWAFICFKNGQRLSNQSGGCKLTTNNEMELYAIYAAMRDFLQSCVNEDNVEIYTDSGYCIGIFTQWAKNWEKRGWKNSLFTAYLERGLRGGADTNRDRSITAIELFDFVSKGVAKDSSQKQHPVMWGNFDNNMSILSWNPSK